MLALAVLALAMADKTHFGWLIGSLFLEVITSGFMVGAIAVLLGTWMLRQRRSGVLLAPGTRGAHCHRPLESCSSSPGRARDRGPQQAGVGTACWSGCGRLIPSRNVAA